MSMVRVQPTGADDGQARGVKPRKIVENKDFSAFASRIVRAYARRVADGDVEALPDLVALSREVDRAIADAVLGLREFGYRWDEIAGRLGVSKHAMCARWGKPSRTPVAAQAVLPTLHGGDWP